jgi:hypothetical protein
MDEYLRSMRHQPPIIRFHVGTSRKIQKNKQAGVSHRMQHGKGKICCSLRSRKHQSAKSGVSAVEYRESVALEERFRRDGWPQVGGGWDVPGLLRENTDPAMAAQLLACTFHRFVSKRPKVRQSGPRSVVLGAPRRLLGPVDRTDGGQAYALERRELASVDAPNFSASVS